MHFLRGSVFTSRWGTSYSAIWERAPLRSIKWVSSALFTRASGWHPKNILLPSQKFRTRSFIKSVEADETDASVTAVRLLRAERLLEVQFSDGLCCRFSAELLRVHSPSAELVGADGQRRLVWGRRGVDLRGAELMGRYGLRLEFSDGHDTGIFSWRLLRHLHTNRTALKRRYLANLRAAGRSRDKTPSA